MKKLQFQLLLSAPYAKPLALHCISFCGLPGLRDFLLIDQQLRRLILSPLGMRAFLHILKTQPYYLDPIQNIYEKTGANKLYHTFIALVRAYSRQAYSRLDHFREFRQTAFSYLGLGNLPASLYKNS